MNNFVLKLYKLSLPRIQIIFFGQCLTVGAKRIEGRGEILGNLLQEFG